MPSTLVAPALASHPLEDQPSMDSIWMEDGSGPSSQWAELGAVWRVVTWEPGLVTICTDSWAVYRGLTLWLPRWWQDDW